MASVAWHFIKARESVEIGPLLFTWFETNPKEPTDCRLYYRSGTGY